MRKLLSAGFSRLWKNKVFWGGVLLMAGYLVLVLVHNYRQASLYNEAPVVIVDVYLTGCFQFIGAFTAIFAALFLGTEYSDGTIRNKLIAGHSRVSVYLSSLIVCAAASLMVCAVTALAAFAVGTPLMGLPARPLDLLWKFAVGILLTIALSAIFTLCAMLIHNKPVLSVVCVVGFFLLIFASIFVMNSLSNPEFITGAYEMTVNGDIVPMEPYPNPGYLRGVKRSVYEFFNDFLPTSQGLQISSFDSLEHPLLLSAYSALIILGSTLAGTLLFRRKDLK